MMTRLSLLLCCVAVVLPLRVVGGQNVTLMDSLTMQDEWTRWKLQYAKVYPGEEEEEYRRQLFYQNLQKIQEHNAKFPVLVSFTQGLNQFSDMTVEEYKEYNRLQPRASLTYRCGSIYRAVAGENLPDTVDWRRWGYVTPVQNQGTCGSCWAFSSAGAIEGQIFKRTRRLVPLSKQQLVDCSRSMGNSGCRGGWPDNAFVYVVREWGGLEWEADYPYTGRDGYCRADYRKERAKIHGCVDVRSMDEQALKRATALVGPISVAIDASLPTFKAYRAGIYQDPRCNRRVLNHVVLVVGYGTLQGRDYWLIKNSWSTMWGMGGYAMIARNQYNMCGIATSASYPVV